MEAIGLVDVDLKQGLCHRFTKPPFVSTAGHGNCALALPSANVNIVILR